MCIRMLPAQLLFICTEEMHARPPLPPKPTEGGGLLRQWKSPGRVARVFRTRVNFALFSGFLFFFFFKLAVAILLAR